jgi:predicted transposase YbfD/YdcC
MFAVEGRLVIAQEKVPDKAGEVQALPALLDAVDVSGAIISLDALYANIADTTEVLRRDKVEVATQYYGSSRKAEAKMFVIWIREHWAIENALHYVIDVVFREDASLSDVGYSAENMALIRRLATNVVRTFDPERGITDARGEMQLMNLNT